VLRRYTRGTKTRPEAYRALRERIYCRGVLTAEEETGKVTGVIYTIAASGMSGSP